MTRTADDARYRPMPGDTRHHPTNPDATRTVTRATDWAVEHWCLTDRHFRPEDTLQVTSLDDWAWEGTYGEVFLPKVRTAHDARFDPLPGDTCTFPDGTSVPAVVTAREGDYVAVQMGGHTDRWSLDFWSCDSPGLLWGVG